VGYSPLRFQEINVGFPKSIDVGERVNQVVPLVSYIVIGSFIGSGLKSGGFTESCDGQSI
jgi:hypothetical protein